MNVYDAVESQLFQKILKANKLKAIPGPADFAKQSSMLNRQSGIYKSLGSQPVNLAKPVCHSTSATYGVYENIPHIHRYSHYKLNELVSSSCAYDLRCQVVLSLMSAWTRTKVAKHHGRLPLCTSPSGRIKGLAPGLAM